MLLMLIDTRDQPPGDGGGGGGREPWIVTALRWAFPWPALIAWLFAAGQVLDGWPGAIALWATIVVATWRVLRWMPTSGGLRDYHQ